MDDKEFKKDWIHQCLMEKHPDYMKKWRDSRNNDD